MAWGRRRGDREKTTRREGKREREIGGQEGRYRVGRDNRRGKE